MGKVFDAWQAAVNDVPETAAIKVNVEKSPNSDIYDIQFNEIKFSYRRVGGKHSIIFNGQSELIGKEVFDGFIAKANTYLSAIGHLPS